MPTALDRIQVLCQPDLYAQVKTLAKHNNRTLSAMAAELLAHAVKTPTYQKQLEEAEIKVPPKADPRMSNPQTQFRADQVQAAMAGADLNEAKLQRLAQAMQILEMLEAQETAIP